MGEDILSGAYARREQEAILEITGLKALLAKAQDQVFAARRGGLLERGSFLYASLSSRLSTSICAGDLSGTRQRDENAGSFAPDNSCDIKIDDLERNAYFETSIPSKLPSHLSSGAQGRERKQETPQDVEHD